MSRRLVPFATWTFLGLVFSSARYVDDLSLGRNTSVPDALAYGLVNWYTYGLLAIPLLSWLVHRFPFSMRSIRSRLPLYFVASLVFSVLHTVITHVLWFERAGFPSLFESRFKVDLVSHYHLNALIFAGIIGFHFASRAYTLARQREVEHARLETLLAESRLEMLRVQLQPHFLFNSLNSVAALIHEDQKAAYDMLAGVADLLRLALERTRRQEVTLAEEVAFIRQYAAVQMTRFSNRLSVDVKVDEEARSALVPSLILQPLVENAIQHGIAPFEKGGSVHVTGNVTNGWLNLRIADSGPGISFDEDFKEGVGLSNCRERLRRLYGDRQRLELRNAEPGGLEVHIVIPHRPADPETVNEDA